MSDDAETGGAPHDPLPGEDPFHGPEWAASSSVTAGTTRSSGLFRRVKVSRRKKRVLRRRRRIGIVLLILGGLVVLAAVYLVVTGLLARSELNHVRADVSTLRTQVSDGNLAGARKTARTLADHASRAHTLTSGPVWALAADLPGGGDALKTVRGVAAAADSLGTNALPQLVRASERIEPSKLRRADGSIDVAPIAAVAPDLDHASAALTAATVSVAKLPTDTWLAAADAARIDVLKKLVSLGTTITAADQAAHIAPAMLGADGPRTYMISFETEAELRGGGGLPGAFGIVRADHGKVSFTRFESDTALLQSSSGVELGAAYDRLYDGADAANNYLSSNVSPHFPDAARIWAGMWQEFSGQKLDGALTIDPTALSYLLAVTGPAELPDHTQVTSANVVSLTQQQVYSKFPANAQAARKAYQLSIAKAISKHLLARTGDTKALLKAAGRAASERRLLAWSADPAVERYLEQTSLGGAIPDTAAPFTGLAINNAGENKLDYYLHVGETWKRTGCGDVRDVVVTITARNDAPLGLPRYVLGGTAGLPSFPGRDGDNVLLFGLYATQDADFTSVTLNGKPFTAQTDSERGHPVFTMTVPLPRGQTQTIVMHLVEPPVAGPPVVMPQPMVNPMTVKVDDAHCS